MKLKNPIQQSAKTAGYAYLIIIVTSILSMIFGPYKLMVEGDTAATIENISSSQFLFRIGATYDLFMFIGVIILSVALYNVLKTVNKTVAQTALISRIGEALIGSFSVVCSITILYLINQEDSNSSSENTIALLFEFKDLIMNIVFSFLGFGSVLFCYLFYKDKLIPRVLAVLGIIAFALVFGESIAVLLFDIKSTIIAGILAIIFEIIVGIWLIVKGVDTSHRPVKSK